MRVLIHPDATSVANWVSEYVIQKINGAVGQKKRPVVLGLPTGSTPLQTYRALITAYSQGRVSFENVITFNLDEYVGLATNDPNSYAAFMTQHLFSHIDINKKNIHLLDGTASNPEQACIEYEKKMKGCGGVNLFIGGVGNDGHIAFNEPGSSLNSRTRIKTLTQETRRANAHFFNNDINRVPNYALTVGVKTLLDAEEVLIIALGPTKANAVQAAVEGSVTHWWTVSALQLHEKAILVCDEAASMKLQSRTIRYFNEVEKGRNSLT